MSIFYKLRWHFFSEWQFYLLGICSLVVVSVLELVPPLIVGWFVDDAVNLSLDFERTVQLSLYLFIAAIGMYLGRIGWRLFIYIPVLRLSTTLRTRIFSFLCNRSSSFFQKHPTGDLMAHSTNDIKAIESVAGDGVLVAADSFISFITVFFMMILYVGPTLSLLAFIPFPILGYAVYHFADLLEKRFTYAQETFSNLNNRTQESFSGIKAVKGHYLYELTCALFNAEAKGNKQAHIDVAKIDMLIEPAINICMAISFVITLFYGAFMIHNNELTVGKLTTFTMYLSGLIWPMFAFGWLFSLVEKGHASYERIETLLKETDDFSVSTIDKHTNTQNQAIPLIKQIDFQINSFYYNKETDFCLNNISLELHQGRKLGIAGKTGAGKSTLIKLLAQEYYLYDGKFVINELHNSFDTDSVWEHVAYVPQETFIFSGTIYDNIRFGNSGLTSTEIIDAAIIAGIDEDINNLSDGYQTLIGERGVNLSGGQKQRLAIARAVALKKSILLLDDPFSALDANTEQLILHNLSNLNFINIMVIISHRLANLIHCEHIIVLEEGSIIEQGNHLKLILNKGWYSDTYEKQKGITKRIDEDGLAAV
jgi:ATP-binding cassette subfamily B multidrug efflux pump